MAQDNKKKTLNQYGLEENLDIIKRIPSPVWKAKVKDATEKKNKQKLIDNCYKKKGVMIVPKTKTQCILKTVENNDYVNHC